MPRAFLLFLLLPLLAGCLEPAPPAATLTLDRDVLEPGAWVNVTMTLVVPDELTYTSPTSHGPTWSIEVLHAGGSVPLYAYGEGLRYVLPVETRQTVRAGTYTHAEPWNGHTEPDPDRDAPHGGDRLAAGTYELRAVWTGEPRVEVFGNVTLA